MTATHLLPLSHVSVLSDEIRVYSLQFDMDAGITLDGRALSVLPHPAAIMDTAGGVMAANALFSVENGLISADGAMVASALLAVLDGKGEVGDPPRCSVDGGQGGRIFDLLVLPLAGSELRLLLAMDRTLEVGMRDALIESRARFMDLVGISGECAWETGADGKFTIITPDSLAGYASKQLIGRDPRDLFDPSMAVPAVLPFATPAPMHDGEVWLRHADGNPRCFEVSAVPLFDADGVWHGARGICRDVTEERQNRRADAQLRLRERLFSRITGLFRRAQNPEEMLRVAVEAIAQGLGGVACRIFVSHLPRGLTVPKLTPVASFGTCTDGAAIDAALDSLIDDADGTPRLIGIEPDFVVAVPTIYGSRVNGAVLLWLDGRTIDWDSQDEQLLEAIASHLAAAIEQRSHYRMLMDASRTDPLTGLLNRRAFDEEINRRFLHLDDKDGPSALLFVDVDNFKLVNDTFGHQSGDEVLRYLADILRGNIRPTDLVARLGGDEFAVWLDGADQEVAVKRAQRFLAAATSLVRYSGTPDKPLHLSIGIAMHEPGSRETMEAFLRRADRAMYRVKRNGKGNLAVAAAPRAVS